jgi:hypothetical protein
MYTYYTFMYMPGTSKADHRRLRTGTPNCHIVPGVNTPATTSPDWRGHPPYGFQRQRYRTRNSTFATSHVRANESRLGPRRSVTGCNSE